jgi:hypothetical protein
MFPVSLAFLNGLLEGGKTVVVEGWCIEFGFAKPHSVFPA